MLPIRSQLHLAGTVKRLTLVVGIAIVTGIEFVLVARDVAVRNIRHVCIVIGISGSPRGDEPYRGLTRRMDGLKPILVPMSSSIF
jgi:hypothetical protein